MRFEITPVDPATLAGLGGFGAAAAPGPTVAPPASDSPFLDRATAARALAAQNPGLPAPAPSCDYVVAGQQAGLLTGPLYTVLKAVSAIALARRRGPSARPLFWIASEDHDVLEVNRLTIAGRRFVHDYEGERARGRVPQVADIPLHAARDPLLAFLREALPPTEFTPWVLDLVAGLDFTSYATAFRGALRALFADRGLLLVDPIALRPLTAPVLAALVERWDEVERALESGTQALAASGLTPTLRHPRVFEIREGRRAPIEIAGGRARRDRAEISTKDLAEEIRRRPEAFSPGAALRPVCQDAALPVAVLLGGPSELIYLRQILPVYDVIGARPAPRHPRISATFVESGPARALARLGLGPAEVLPALSRAAADAEGAPPEGSPADAVARKGRELLAEIDGIRRPDAPRWLRQGREEIASGIRRVVERVEDERRAAAGLDRARREKLRRTLLPDGRLQERGANVFEFLNRHGPEFIARAIESLDPLTAAHQVVVIAHDEAKERA
jgi:bacillithiol biosynthesis cysteine-adding enzyme BshC